MDSKTLCLGVLTLGDASGYEIKKQVEEGCFAHFHAASFGSIYPALAQLSTEGAVTFYTDSQDGRPDRKVYQITEAGRDRFRQALHVPPVADRVRSDAVFMLFFSELLDVAHRARVYDGYQDFYRQIIESMEQHDVADMPPGARWAHGLGLTFYRAAEAYLRDNRHLLFDPPSPDAADDGGDEDGRADADALLAGVRR